MSEAIHDISSGAITMAVNRLRPYLRPTPLILSHGLTKTFGRRVWLKLETQQPTGSFKIRPALNGVLARLSEAKAKGVIASSSGNFAQAVAYAAHLLEIDALLIMTSGTSAFKIEKTKAWGSQIVICGNSFEERWETTYRLQKETGRVLLHPYDSEETILGDATLGAELLEQVDGNFTCLVPMSGGGLFASTAISVKGVRPGCRIIGIQPKANSSWIRSMELGRPFNVGKVTTLADALIAAEPGQNTFSLVRKFGGEVFAVEEQAIQDALRWLARQQYLIAEPAGAIAVAALFSDMSRLSGSEDVVCIVSGGNISLDTFSAWVS